MPDSKIDRREKERSADALGMLKGGEFGSLLLSNAIVHGQHAEKGEEETERGQEMPDVVDVVGLQQNARLVARSDMAG